MAATRSKRIRRTASESVSFGTIGALTVLPDDAPTQVVQSATQQFTVTGADAHGAAIPLPSGSIAWTVDEVAAGTISTAGLFTAGVAPAADYAVTATHTATGVAATVVVEVTAV